MIGILILSHGQLAEGLIDATRLLIGEKENLQAICLHAQDNADEFQSKIENKVKELDSGDGVLIFADILGGTPFNRSLAVATQNSNIEVVSGVNLPVLLEILMERESFSSLTDAIKCVEEISKDSITIAPLHANDNEGIDSLDSAME